MYMEDTHKECARPSKARTRLRMIGVYSGSLVKRTNLPAKSRSMTKSRVSMTIQEESLRRSRVISQNSVRKRI